ncbi:hypothetical protein B0O99DRAFT_600316 [Bisporella sp. PMI_857]|nr:hypothetical protein B0O99DRAFT_600316 [Bisporella sp. PMI_857]
MAPPIASSVSVELTKIQANGVRAAIHQWTTANLISETLSSELLSTIQIKEPSFNYEKFAKYSFRLAILCLAVAVVSLLADNAFLKLIKRIIALHPFLRSALTALLAIAVHVWGHNRSLQTPGEVYLNEAIHSLGSLLFALAGLQLAEGLDVSKAEHQHRVHYVLFLLSVIYFGAGLAAKSAFIWSCGMIALGTSFGAVTGYISGWGAYYLGMSYPFRFVFFGLSIIGLAYLMAGFELTSPLWSTTRIWGLLYFFIALWILSIFGNDDLFSDSNHTTYRGRGHGRLFIWSLMFFGAASVSMWHGLRYADGTTKGFGLTFLGINLYTKFFELFWDQWYKPLFFAVLAGTLAIIGRYAELVWNLQIVSSGSVKN